MTRRGFLQWLHRFVWGAWGFFGLILLGRYLTPGERRRGLLQHVAKADEIPVGESRLVYYEDQPVLLIHYKENQWVALSAICTHLRCGLSWNRESERITCPCHGATYDLNGNVLSGPAPRPLPRFHPYLRNGFIFLERIA